MAITQNIYMAAILTHAFEASLEIFTGRKMELLGLELVNKMRCLAKCAFNSCRRDTQNRKK